jgi:hypothetical protein
MNNKLDIFGYVVVAFTIIFCGWGFYWIFSDISSVLAAKIGFSAFWLILSFMFIIYSIGIGKGEERTKIKIPKCPAVIVFSIAGVMLIIAVVLNGGL